MVQNDVGLPKPLGGSGSSEVNSIRCHFVGSGMEAAPDRPPIESPPLTVQGRQRWANEIVHVRTTQSTPYLPRNGRRPNCPR